MHFSSRSESDDREIYESRKKRQKTSEKYHRKEKRHDGSDVEKYHRKEKRHGDGDVEKYRHDDNDIEKYRHDDNDVEKYRHGDNDVEKYGHDDNDIEKYDDIESYKKRRKSNKRERSYERDERRENKYVKNKYNKEKNHERSPTTDSFDDKRSHFSSRDRRSREYVDLDNPNRRNDESFEDETVNKTEDKEKNSKKADIEPLSKREKIGNINTRTGGAYIPPAKLRMMQESIQDKSR